MIGPPKRATTRPGWAAPEVTAGKPARLLEMESGAGLLVVMEVVPGSRAGITTIAAVALHAERAASQGTMRAAVVAKYCYQHDT